MNPASLLSLSTTLNPAAPAQTPAAAGDTAPAEGFAAMLGLVIAPAGNTAAVLPETGKAAATGGNILPVAANLVLPEGEARDILPGEAATESAEIPVDAPADAPLTLLSAITMIPLPAAPAPVAAQSAAEPEKPTSASAAIPLQFTRQQPILSATHTTPAAAPAAAPLAASVLQAPVAGQQAQGAGEGQSPAPAQAARPALQLQVEVRPLPATAAPVAAAASTLPAGQAAVVAAAAPMVAAPVVQQAKQDASGRRTEAQAMPAIAATVPAAAEGEGEARPAAPMPLPPVAPSATITPLLAEIQRPAGMDPAGQQPVAASAVPDRHDFTAIVDRLAQARELARPGQATMQLAHRDFGPVSVQFEMTGPTLKVALASADAAFAPAVQAALAERPILAPAEAQPVRADVRQDAGTTATTSAQAGGAAVQQDGQRHDTPSRGNAPRHAGEQVQRQPQDARQDDAAGTGRGRDGSRFA